MLDEDQPRYQTCKVCGAKDCDCTERDLRAFQAGAASRDAELWGRTQKILQLEQQLAAEQAKNVGLRAMKEQP